MPDWLNAVILGLVEGLTEFIPVSSTGHLVLTKTALGLTQPSWDTFIILIQLGAILAVVALYIERLWRVLLRLPSDPNARRFVLSVLVAFLPAALMGVAFNHMIEAALSAPKLICVALIVGGVILLIVDRWPPQPREFDAMRYPLLTALGIGLFQCLSLIPGASRSGSTIVGALLLRCDRRSAAEFSFFLAMPTMAGAFAFDLLKHHKEIDFSQMGLIAIGFGVALVSGALVVRWMLGFVSRRGFGLFGWWRIVVGALGLVMLTYAGK